MKGHVWTKEIGPQEPQRKGNQTKFKIVFNVAMMQASRAPSWVHGCPFVCLLSILLLCFHFISLF